MFTGESRTWLRAAKDGGYLSNILVQLQVHDARLRDAIAQMNDAQDKVVDKYTLIAYLYRLGELYALVGSLFGFARGEERFKEERLNWEDFRNAYGIMNVEVEDFFINDQMNLEAFVKRALGRRENSTP